ncbi:uncharacterized protein TNCV_5094601 [Trichonephila clavipes]|nr:uncharacterized protein TNCV_5094601 [Trichonephila clavipes]
MCSWGTGRPSSFPALPKLIWWDSWGCNLGQSLSNHGSHVFYRRKIRRASRPEKQFNLIIDEEPLDNACHVWSYIILLKYGCGQALKDVVKILRTGVQSRSSGVIRLINLFKIVTLRSRVQPIGSANKECSAGLFETPHSQKFSKSDFLKAHSHHPIKRLTPTSMLLPPHWFLHPSPRLPSPAKYQHQAIFNSK